MRGSTYVKGRVHNALSVPTRQTVLFQFASKFVEIRYESGIASKDKTYVSNSIKTRPAVLERRDGRTNRGISDGYDYLYEFFT
jgi:hypothetical protein